MRVSSLREFRRRATQLLRHPAPLLITGHGRLAGIFIPCTAESRPIDWKRQLFLALAADLARQLKQEKSSEAAVLQDFAAWKTKRRAG